MKDSLDILVVDDDEMVRTLIQSMISLLGHAVVTAPGGEDALEAVSLHKPDLIFTDLQMPGMTGLDLIAELKDKDADLPIIVISGAGTINEAIEAIRLGAWDYINKPVRLPELEIVIQQVSEKARLLSENRAYQHYLEDLILERTLKLRDSDMRFRTIFESANDAILLMLDENIISCNNKALQLFQRSQDELLGATLLSLSPPKQPGGTDSGEILHRHLALALEGEPQFYEWRHIKQDGEPFDTEISLNRLKLQDTYHLQAIMRDVTERKKAEQAVLDNLRLKQELEIARAIQRSLLPSHPPRATGVVIASCCQPAASLGGDYYDFFSPGQGVIDVVIADVAGHNIGSALLMVEARSMLHARIDRGHSPGKLLTDLNKLLYEDLSQAELQMSMFSARIDSNRGTVTYANAGHVRPLLLRVASGEMEELDTEGMLMGISSDVAIEEAATKVLDGDVILFYTDGILDAENGSGDFFGAERLREALRELCRCEPEEIISHLLRSIASFAGNDPLTDDVTIVAVKISRNGEVVPAPQ